MHKLREKDIEIQFTGVLRAMRFDQDDPKLPNFHDLRNMPRVDFIIETTDTIYFIEIKDPERADLKEEEKAPFFRKLENGKFENSLVNKYLCTFLFRWAEGELGKSVRYLILTSLDDAMVSNLNDLLNRRFAPLLKKSSRWSLLPLASCEVHSFGTWSITYPDWNVARVGA